MLAFHCLSFFLWGEERKNCNCLTFSETFSVSSCGKNRWMPWTHWLRSQFIQAVGRKDMSLLPGTPRPTIYKGLFQWDDSKSLYRKWLLHQTSIYKMVGLGVPGRQNLASPPGSQRFFKKPFESTQGGERFEWVFLGGWANQSLAKTMNPEIWIC